MLSQSNGGTATVLRTEARIFAPIFLFRQNYRLIYRVSSITVQYIPEPGSYRPPSAEHTIMSQNTDRSTAAKPTNQQQAAEYVVLGGGQLGVAVARRLLADGRSVTVVDDASEPEDVPSVRGDPDDVRTLEQAGLDEASMVLVAMPRDRQNLLVAQLVRTNFGVDDIFVLVRSPDRYEVVESAGHEPICATTYLSDALVETVDGRAREESRTA